MNRDAITQLVRERAVRFGENNPQQFDQLAMRLAKADATEAVHGLLQVFITGEPAPQSSPAQELAGRLLATLEPVELKDVKSTLRASLSRYELSVEQFPQYLAKACGADAVYSALCELESEPLSQTEARAVETMKFWLRGRARTAMSRDSS